MSHSNEKNSTYYGHSNQRGISIANECFGYPKPLNIIVKESMLPESELSPIWAAYFNMARYNMYTTLVHISAATGMSDGENMENRMDKMKVLNEKVAPEIELRLIKLICSHFPFVSWMCTSSDSEGDINGLTTSLEDMRHCLKTISFTLNYYRNLYSHTRTIEKRSEEEIAKSRYSERRTGKYLKKICTVSARRVKIRFCDKDNKVQAGMIDDQSLRFITEGKVKMNVKMQNGSSLLDEKGRKIKETKDNPNYFLNPLVLDNNGALRDGKNPEKLSTAGKLQLICLLLEKKYITEFLTQSKFLNAFKGVAQAPRLSDRRLILEVLSDLRIRMPQNRIDSTRDDVQVALDMLNELKKCPYELFELLGPEDRASFSLTSSNGEHILLRRSSDRFTQLALQWFDSNKAFSRIRFQLNAGVFRYLFNERKTCLDGKTRLRVLQKPLNCFGRIQEAEEIRTSHKDGNGGPWAGFKIKGFDEAACNDTECLPYINDARTRYLIDCDNIGIRFGEEGESSGDYLPSIGLKDGKYRISCKPAQCTMSIYELQAMLFLHMLNPGKDEGPAPVEKIIIDKVEAYRELFSDIRDGRLTPKGQDDTSLNEALIANYGIDLTGLPEKMRDYLLGKVNDRSSFKAYRKRLVDTLKEETEFRMMRLSENLKAMRSDMNKPGKPGFVQLRPGELATFIANDIVFFQEGNSNQKMTGLNFSIMQGLIATFGSRDGATADDLKAAFSNSGLISSNGNCGTHPFLAKAFNARANNTVALYSEYLKARKTYLSGDILDTAAFLHADRMKWAVRDNTYYKEYADRCLKQPIILPRRLFESAIREFLLSLKSNGANELKEKIRVAGNRCNSAYMINCYFDCILNDSPQMFHGVCEGDIEHTFGHKFFQVIRKNLKAAEELLERLKKEKGNSHKTYIAALQSAIKWAKKNSLPEPKKHVRGTRQMVLSREETAAIIKRAFNEYTATEKTLRRYVVQDELLFMAAMKTIRKMLGMDDKEGMDWKLGNIGPRTASVLDTVLPSVKTKTRFSNVKKNSYTHEIIGEDSIEIEIEQRNIPIKDFGDVYRLLADERLYGLLKYHRDDVLLASDLKSELETYDQRRVGVFKDILNYEEKVTKGLSDIQLCEAKPKVNSKDIDFKVMQWFDNENDDLTKSELRAIRNAFCHNSYPDKVIHLPGKQKTLHNAEVPGTANEVSDRVREISSKTRGK